MPPRSAQTLVFRCVDGQSPEACAALYGIGLPQWQVLFLEAARHLAGLRQPLPDAERLALAPRLENALQEGDPKLATLTLPLSDLIRQRDEVRALIAAAELAAAQSPERNRETWLRRVAVVLIIAVSIYVWWRDKDKPPETPGMRARPTAPR
jgi:hypothetical protein